MLIKFIRSLSSKWDGITMAIGQAKDLQATSLQALYGNLLTYEFEVQQRKCQVKEAQNKSVALVSTNKVKSVVARPRQVEEEGDIYDEEDENEKEL